MKKDGRIGPSYGHRSVLQLEVENIHYLEIHPVYQDDVSANEHVRTVRWWRGQLPFEVWRAGIHFPSQFDGKDSAHYNPSFHIGRQAVPIPQAGRQVIVMRRVPAVHRVMIVVGVETIFVMVTSFVVVTSFAGFLPVMPAIMVTSFVLGQSEIAAKREYGRDEYS